MRPRDGNEEARKEFAGATAQPPAKGGQGPRTARPGHARVAASALVSPPASSHPPEEGGPLVIGGSGDARGIGTSPPRTLLRRLSDAFGSFSTFIHTLHDLARSTRQWVSLHSDPETGTLRLDAAPTPAPAAILALDARPLARLPARQAIAWLWAHTQVIDWQVVATKLEEPPVASVPNSGQNREEGTLEQGRPTMPHVFDPANMQRLLDPSRREWNDPERILLHLDALDGSTVVDIGCGPGYFAIPAAKIVGDKGKVYAVDISREMLNACAERAKQAGVADKVYIVEATDDDEFPVPTDTADVALLANVYHEMDPASNFLHELRRIVRPGGLALVVDWKPEETPIGPPVGERLNQQDVTEEFTHAGFVLAGTCEIGPYHYGLKFYLPVGPDDQHPAQGFRKPLAPPCNT